MLKGIQKTEIRKIYNKTAYYYDLYHSLGTYGFDGKGRNIIVDKIIEKNDYVLDAGGGTGTTGIKAGSVVRENGKVVIMDLSENMLDQAKAKIKKLGMTERFELKIGDMYSIPYPDDTFDKVVSTYSTCPLENPLKAVEEMVRVLKRGGILGIAHSTGSDNRIANWISSKVDRIIWLFPRLSLGCRKISLVDGVRKMNVDLIEQTTIGMIPFYFKILIIRKP
jgi:ubiquinone/menaquinone biosynthesis C-methylase UbiE